MRRRPPFFDSHRASSALAVVGTALVLAALTACSDAPAPSVAPQCEAEPLPGSGPALGPDELQGRALPAWFDDAKLGIMVHWGVWAVPGWAETTLDPERVADPTDPDYLLAPGGVERFMRHNPYTEWYENSLAIGDTATAAYHREAWGEDFPYTGFQPLFEEGIAQWRADSWASLFREAGARYVVLVTKHHDGYALWPSAVANPRRPGWLSTRDVVGEVADSVRAQCMRIGLYYSGGIDWSFRAPPIATLVDFALATPTEPEYAAYVDAHWRELIARYRPAVLWNDISSPAATDEKALFADYYAAVPDGVVNDRWGSLDPRELHRDFEAVEYDVRDEIRATKWEAVRGIGRTFGFNRNEPIEDYGTAEKYIHLLVDVVSKNGNLLLNVGPTASGDIPAPQVEVLRGLGAWLATNGEAIFGTRPWTRFAGETADGIPVRFTRGAGGDVVYATLLGTPPGTSVVLAGFAEEAASVRLLGRDEALSWSREGSGLRIELETPLPAGAAHSFAIALAAG